MFNDRTFRIMKLASKNASKMDNTPEAQKAWEKGAEDAFRLIK